MSKITDMVKEWVAGTLGGSVDLSAVDQDVTVLNNHVIDFQSPTIGDDSEAHGTIGWSDDAYAVTVIGSPDGDTTDLYLVGPTSFNDRLFLDVQPGHAGIGLFAGGGPAQGAIQQNGETMMISANHVRIDSIGAGGVGQLGGVTISTPGAGITFTSPDGLTTKTLSIDDSGDPVWT